MQPNTYPDGFPLTALEAIDYSYFLSESEKQYWRDWLKTVNPEQENELVDILHNMWQDNQKQAVPEAFNLNTAQSPIPPQVVSTPQSAPQLSPVPQSAPEVVAPVSQPFNFVEATPAITQPQPLQDPFLQNIPPVVAEPNPFQNNSTPHVETTAKLDTPKADFSDFSFSDDSTDSNNLDNGFEENINNSFSFEDQSNEDEKQHEALRKIANAKYSPNPILDDKTPTPDEFIYKNGNHDVHTESDVAEHLDIEEDQVDYSPNSQDSLNSESIEQKKKKFFNSAKVRESATKQVLQEIYDNYLESRDKSFSSAKEYEQNHAEFLDKIMQVVINFEEVADYYETIIEKILEVNDKVVLQAKDIQHLKNSSMSTGGMSLQEQIDEIRDEIDKVNRDMRSFRTENRKRYDEVSSQLASFGADAYRQEGVLQRLDLLKSEIIQIQQHLGLHDSGQKNLKVSLPSKPDFSPDQTIDLRDKI